MENFIRMHYFMSARQFAKLRDDPIDALSVHAYIARIQHEVVVDDKHERDNANEGLSKRKMKSKKKQQ